MIEISMHEPIATIVENHPDVLGLMAEVGFAQILNPLMLKTAGKVMSIYSGCSLRKIDLEQVKATFLLHGYKLID